MDNGRMNEALSKAFDDEIRRTIVEHLDEAYQLAAARYDEGIGCNGFTFGTDLYHLVKFRLQDCGDEASTPITLGETASELELRLKVGGFNVACHRVGFSGDQDIENCFPSSSGGPGRLAQLNSLQLELELTWDGPPPLPHNVVIAHMGNPDHGLEAVYLAVPRGVSESGKINSWAFTELVWRWDGQDSEGIPTPDLPPAVPIEDALVQLRRSLDETEETSS